MGWNIVWSEPKQTILWIIACWAFVRQCKISFTMVVSCASCSPFCAMKVSKDKIGDFSWITRQRFNWPYRFHQCTCLDSGYPRSTGFHQLLHPASYVRNTRSLGGSAVHMDLLKKRQDLCCTTLACYKLWHCTQKH